MTTASDGSLRQNVATRVSTATREYWARFYDSIMAVLIILLSQLLICALQQATKSINDFPAPILAMALVAGVLILISTIVSGMDGVYNNYLRSPTDLINRHMSIGFIVPFIMTMKNPMLSSKMVGLVAAGFMITGLLNTVSVYLFSYGMQKALSAFRTKKQSHQAEKSPPTAPTAMAVDRSSPDTGQPRSRSRIRSAISDSTTLAGIPPVHASDGGAETDKTATDHQSPVPIQEQTKPMGATACYFKRVQQFCWAHPVLAFSVLGIAAIGIPVSLATDNDTALDTFLLFSLWNGTLVAQMAVKKAERLQNHRRWRTVLATLLNAVLWGSLGIIAYTAAKARVRRRSISEALVSFSTGNTLADMIDAPQQPGQYTMGAGDIALSILDSGIVSWGLKLFECRTQLLSRAGLTTLVAGAVFAIVNIVCGPLLMHAMGLVPSSFALSFAARSVTLALSGPAMASLGGDVGLNAAMVVFNGVVFQVVMGLGVCHWAARSLGFGNRKDAVSESCKGVQMSGSLETDDDVRRLADVEEMAGLDKRRHEVHAISTRGDTPRTVATGMAVGINAAAMGTAYLYETGSRAAPYSTLSMTVFGVMTVVFTSIQPLTTWLVSCVA